MLCGCGGTLWFTPNGHRFFYRSQNGEISCYSNSCCWPYKEREMICVMADPDINGGFTVGQAHVFIKYIPDK